MTRTVVLLPFLMVAAACGTARETGSPADSGRAALKRGDSVSAERWATKAIALNPADVAALRLRSAINRGHGNYDLAIADDDRAIESKGPDATIFSERGFSYQAKGNYALAIQDFDRAIALDSNHALALKNRARSHFYLGHFAEAAADFERGAALDSTNAYVAIWLYVAKRRLGRNDTTTLAAQLAKSDTTRWPTPVGQFFLGRITEPQLMEASSAVDPRVQHDQRCAASFYLGENALVLKRTADAGRLLTAARDGCPHTWTEYAGAVAELTRLSAP